MQTRRLLLCFALLLISSKIFAQGTVDPRSFPDSNFSWNETSDHVDSEGNDLRDYKKTDITYYDDGDTIVNNIHYRKLNIITVNYKYSYNSNSGTIYISQIDNFEDLFGLLRNDKQDKKVYLMDKYSNVEYVLYDFGLKLKDKVTMNYFPALANQDNYVIRIDSIIDPNGVARKIFRYSNNLADTNSLSMGRTQRFIEGIGMSHGIYDKAVRLPGENYIRDLDCIKLDNNRIFNISVSPIDPSDIRIVTTEYCNRVKFYSTGIDNTTTKSLTIYPNPSENIINFNINDEIELVEIFDSKLTLIKSSKQLRNKFLDISQLPSGIYFCKVYSKGKYYSAKFLKK